MRQRIIALFVSVLLATAGLGVAVSIASSSSPARAATTTSSKCKKCKKVIKKAKKCKKAHNHSAKCKKTIKKAKKCKKVLKSKKCKKPSTSPTASPSGGGDSNAKQEEKGTIAEPNPFPADPNSCYSGKYRREAVLTNGANKGTDGYHFDVDPGTIGKNFLLTVDSGEQNPDLDITFYTTLGTQQEAADPQNAPPNQSFETRAAGGEHGVVPQGMKVAIVCMQAGVNAAFTYTAGAGVETPK